MNFEQAEMVLSKSVSMQPRQRQPHRTRALWAKSQSRHGSRAESRLSIALVGRRIGPMPVRVKFSWLTDASSEAILSKWRAGWRWSMGLALLF